MSTDERLERIERRLAGLESADRDRDHEVGRLAEAVSDLAQAIDLSDRGVLR